MDIIGYSKNTHKNPKTSPNQGIHNQVPWLGLVSLFQIWDFSGYSLNTLKIYPKMEICYFFLWNKLHFFFDDNLVWSLVSQFLSCECSHFGGNYKKNKKVKNLAHIFYRKVKKISHTFIRRWKNFLTLPLCSSIFNLFLCYLPMPVAMLVAMLSEISGYEEQ